MKIDNNIINEKIEINKDNYIFTHGNLPRGGGSFIFSKNKYIDFNKDKENIDYIRTTFGKYKDAEKIAIQWAKKQGYLSIYLAT